MMELFLLDASISADMMVKPRESDWRYDEDHYRGLSKTVGRTLFSSY